jgi:hypothetical protein
VVIIRFVDLDESTSGGGQRLEFVSDDLHEVR